MPPVRTVYVPCFSPQLRSSQREPAQTRDRMEAPSPDPRTKRGKKRVNVPGEKSRSVVKDKFPKFDKRVSKEDKKPKRLALGSATNQTSTTTSKGGETRGAGSDPEAAGRDAYFFSQRPTNKAMNEKEKAKLAVLRTIYRVLEENQLIRQRLVALSHAN